MGFAFELELMIIPIRAIAQTGQEGDEVVRFVVFLGTEQIVFPTGAELRLGEILEGGKIFGLDADRLELRTGAAENRLLNRLLGKIEAQFLQLCPRSALPRQ